MKKILLFTLTVLIVLLGGCDYPEKSFNALDRSKIPIEVTQDFTLQAGVYGKFVWTSNSELITIEGLTAKVTQTDEDVTVTLTATINQQKESFSIIVLKEGSITVYEKAETAFSYLEENFKILTNDITVMPKELESLYIKYSNSHVFDYVGLYVDTNDQTYLSNNFKYTSDELGIWVYFYKDQNYQTLVKTYQLNFHVEQMTDDDPFMIALKQLNIHNYDYNNGTITIQNLKVKDLIEIKDTQDFNYLLTYNSKYFKKNTNYQLTLIKALDDNYFGGPGIYITIGNMQKTVKFNLSMK